MPLFDVLPPLFFNIMSDDKPTIIVYGNYIQEQNIETQNNYYGKKAPEQEEMDDSIVKELMPVFFNKEDAARQFLQEIQGREGKGVVKLVKELVKKGAIIEELSHKYLYDILTRHGLYSFSLTNWNKQLI